MSLGWTELALRRRQAQESGIGQYLTSRLCCWGISLPYSLCRFEPLLMYGLFVDDAQAKPRIHTS